MSDECRTQSGGRGPILAVINAYRKQFAVPLQSVNMSLRNYLKSLGIQGDVTQRLKRMPTIVDKLTNRETELDLSRMRDIAGCRVVITRNDIGDLRALADYIAMQNPHAKLIDYVSTPRSSGYRALHVEVERHGRAVEVQLRTPHMHTWAESAEAFSEILNKNFK